jgi:hypothetical protein
LVRCPVFRRIERVNVYGLIMIKLWRVEVPGQNVL